MSSTFRVLIGFAVGIAVGIGIGVAITSIGSSPTTELRAAFDDEFIRRPDGYPVLKKNYGLEFQSGPLSIPVLKFGLKYQKLVLGEVHVIDGFSTDASMLEHNLAVLEDDKAMFPPYEAAPLIRAATLRKYPDLEAILNRLGGKIPSETMQSLNHKVEREKRNVHQVARDFLESQKLIPEGAAPAAHTAGSIIIGSKNITEQKILGEIMAILIEYKTGIQVVRRLDLGGTMICFGALTAGAIDLYPEYTGTGWVRILGQPPIVFEVSDQPPISDPEKTYEKVKEAFRQAPYNLVWLKRFGLNNTYALYMRRAHAQELDIGTISDLASYVKQH